METNPLKETMNRRDYPSDRYVLGERFVFGRRFERDTVSTMIVNSNFTYVLFVNMGSSGDGERI